MGTAFAAIATIVGGLIAIFIICCFESAGDIKDERIEEMKKKNEEHRNDDIY